MGLTAVTLAVVGSIILVDFFDLRGRLTDVYKSVPGIHGLTQSVNVYRVRFAKSCKGCDLSGRDLSLLDLSGVNLTEAKLVETKFDGANLFESDLSGMTAHNASFIGANLSEANLESADLDGVDLSEANLTNAKLSSVDLKDASLKETELQFTDLSNSKLNRSDLSGATMVDVSLKGANFERTFLGETEFRFSGPLEADFSDAILEKVDLRGLNLSNSSFQRANLRSTNLSKAILSGANLNRAVLSGANLEQADLSQSNLTDAYLYDANLSSANLKESVLNGARLSGANLAGADLTGAQSDGEWLTSDSMAKRASIPLGQRFNVEIPGLVTSLVPDGSGWLITAQGGQVFSYVDKAISKVFDISGIKSFSTGGESGLLSIATQGQFIYLSFTLQEKSGKTATTLVVNEYTRQFDLVRNIARIEFPTDWHHGGTLGFDEEGALYLSTGDGEGRDPQKLSQNPDALQGKILRIDISEKSPVMQVVALGFRNPWKFSIDQAGRMFIGDVGGIWREEVNLIEDLGNPLKNLNFGHSVFEGSKPLLEDPLDFGETVPPIFEYEHHRESGLPVSVIGGYFLHEWNAYVFGGMSGFIRVLKEDATGSKAWRETHYERLPMLITTFGYDGSDILLVAGVQDFSMQKSVIYDLALSREILDGMPWVQFCKTTLPDGSNRDDHCDHLE